MRFLISPPPSLQTKKGGSNGFADRHKDRRAVRLPIRPAKSMVEPRTPETKKPPTKAICGGCPPCVRAAKPGYRYSDNTFTVAHCQYWCQYFLYFPTALRLHLLHSKTLHPSRLTKRKTHLWPSSKQDILFSGAHLSISLISLFLLMNTTALREKGWNLYTATASAAIGHNTFFKADSVSFPYLKIYLAGGALGESVGVFHFLHPPGSARDIGAASIYPKSPNQTTWKGHMNNS